MKPMRRWCVVTASGAELIWMLNTSAKGETKTSYLRRMCRYFGEPIAAKGMRLVEIEIREVKGR